MQIKSRVRLSRVRLFLFFSVRDYGDLLFPALRSHQVSHPIMSSFTKYTIRRPKLRLVLIPQLSRHSVFFCLFGIAHRLQPMLTCPHLSLTLTDFVSGPRATNLSYLGLISIVALLRGGRIPDFEKSGARSWKEAAHGRTTIRSTRS